jgi:hypothetical protein
MAAPKPRREGQSGGMNHTRSQASSARRGGDPGRYGGGGGKPPKSGCPLKALVLMLYLVTPVTAFAGMIYLRHAA